jgi:hypothetical protein
LITKIAMKNESGGNKENEEQHCPKPGIIPQYQRDAAGQLAKDRADKEKIGIRRNTVAGHVLRRPSEIVDFPCPRFEENQDQKNSSNQYTETF